MARLKEKWRAELAEWQTQRPDDLEAVYLWVSVGGWDLCESGARKGESGLTSGLSRVEQQAQGAAARHAGLSRTTASWVAVLRDFAQRGYPDALRPSA